MKGGVAQVNSVRIWNPVFASGHQVQPDSLTVSATQPITPPCAALAVGVSCRVLWLLCARRILIQA